jgi:hypothetical protein
MLFVTLHLSIQLLIAVYWALTYILACNVLLAPPIKHSNAFS